MAHDARDSSSLDLRVFDAPQRGHIWRLAVARLFPGLRVCGQMPTPPAGRLSSVALDQCQLWTVLSPALCVRHAPAAGGDLRGTCISLLLQRTGTTLARQAGRECRLHARDLTLIDDSLPFELEIPEGLSEFIFLRVPRALILARLPQAPLTASRIDTEAPLASLLVAMLQKLPGTIERLNDTEQRQTLEAILQLLPPPVHGVAAEPRDTGWRVQAAIAFIDDQLADRLLCAERVAAAQGIGRRRLDEILSRELGTSVTAQIWQRRLLRAADDLRNPRLQTCSVTQIALQCGFEHGAHFTRAFRRHFRCTPSQWRAQRHDC